MSSTSSFQRKLLWVDSTQKPRINFHYFFSPWIESTTSAIDVYGCYIFQLITCCCCWSSVLLFTVFPWKSKFTKMISLTAFVTKGYTPAQDKFELRRSRLHPVRHHHLKLIDISHVGRHSASDREHLRSSLQVSQDPPKKTCQLVQDATENPAASSTFPRPSTWKSSAETQRLPSAARHAHFHDHF